MNGDEDLIVKDSALRTQVPSSAQQMYLIMKHGGSQMHRHSGFFLKPPFNKATHNHEDNDGVLQRHCTRYSCCSSTVILWNDNIEIGIEFGNW